VKRRSCTSSSDEVSSGAFARTSRFPEDSMAVCPECDAEIEIDEFDVDKGEIISCPECGVDLEVVGLAPLDLDLAPREEDDWEE
jgi:alpha-aminoadipate carrier protein LysW